MAIQRTSDLSNRHIVQFVDHEMIDAVEDAYYGGTQIPKSLTEIQWQKGETGGVYKTQAITLGALSIGCIHPPRSMDFDFYNTKTFHDDVFFDHGLSVSESNLDLDGEYAGPIVDSPVMSSMPGKNSVPETITPPFPTQQPNKRRVPQIKDYKQVVNVEYLLGELNEIIKFLRYSVFPVGSIYITAAGKDKCPLEGIFGQWKKLQGLYILASGKLYSGGKEYEIDSYVPSILPNIYGKITNAPEIPCNVSKKQILIPCHACEGALFAMRGDNDKVAWFNNKVPSEKINATGINIDASKCNSIYKDVDEVIPKSYVVDVWKRTDGEVSDFFQFSAICENGIVDGTERGIYPSGTPITVNAIPNGGYNFLDWEDQDGNKSYLNPYTFNIQKDTSLTAHCSNKPSEKVKLEIACVECTVTGAQSGDYEKGTELTATVDPNQGCEWKRWSDNNQDNPRVIRMDKNVQLTAYCQGDQPIQQNHTLTVETSYTTVFVGENETKVIGKQSFTFEHGTTVKIRAVANKNMLFFGYSLEEYDSQYKKKDLLVKVQGTTYNINMLCDIKIKAYSATPKEEYTTIRVTRQFDGPIPSKDQYGNNTSGNYGCFSMSGQKDGVDCQLRDVYASQGYSFDHGTNAAIWIQKSAHWAKVKSWVVDGVNRGSINSFQFTPSQMENDHTVVVTWEREEGVPWD